ncbi:unnamed protein product, partial [marine sediment metagenome]
MPDFALISPRICPKSGKTVHFCSRYPRIHPKARRNWDEFLAGNQEQLHPNEMRLKRKQVWNWGLISLMLITIGPALIAYWYLNLANTCILQSTLNGPNLEQLALTQHFLDHAEQYMPSLPHLPYWRGQAHFLAGEQRKALDTWHKYPEAGYLLIGRGKVELMRGQAESALKLLEMATSLDPSSSTIRYYGGVALFRMKRYDEALVWFNEALILDQFDERFAQDLNVGDVWWPARPDNLT